MVARLKKGDDKNGSKESGVLGMIKYLLIFTIGFWLVGVIVANVLGYVFNLGDFGEEIGWIFLLLAVLSGALLILFVIIYLIKLLFRKLR